MHNDEVQKQKIAAIQNFLVDIAKWTMQCNQYFFKLFIPGRPPVVSEHTLVKNTWSICNKILWESSDQLQCWKQLHHLINSTKRGILTWTTRSSMPLTAWICVPYKIAVTPVNISKNIILIVQNFYRKGAALLHSCVPLQHWRWIVGDQKTETLLALYLRCQIQYHKSDRNSTSKVS